MGWSRIGSGQVEEKESDSPTDRTISPRRSQDGHRLSSISPASLMRRGPPPRRARGLPDQVWAPRAARSLRPAAGNPLDTLLAELASTAGVSVSRNGASAQHAHRPFVDAALILTLSLGAG